MKKTLLKVKVKIGETTVSWNKKYFKDGKEAVDSLINYLNKYKDLIII